MLRVYNSPIFAKKGTKIPSRFDKLVERINFAKLGTKLPKFQQGKLLPVDTRGERVDTNETGLRQAFMENNFFYKWAKSKRSGWSFSNYACDISGLSKSKF